MSRIPACPALRGYSSALTRFNLVLINHHFGLHNQKKESFHKYFLIILVRPGQCKCVEANIQHGHRLLTQIFRELMKMDHHESFYSRSNQ